MFEIEVMAILFGSSHAHWNAYAKENNFKMDYGRIPNIPTQTVLIPSPPLRALSKSKPPLLHEVLWQIGREVFDLTNNPGRQYEWRAVLERQQLNVVNVRTFCVGDMVRVTVQRATHTFVSYMVCCPVGWKCFNERQGREMQERLEMMGCLMPRMNLAHTLLE